MKKLFQRQIWRWMRPVLAVLCPCLLVFAGICFYIVHQLDTSFQQSSISLNSLIQGSADKRLEEIYRYTLTLELNNANAFLRGTQSVPQPLPSSVYRLHDMMQDYVTTNPIVDAIYIYYPDLDFTVGNLGCYQASSYRALQNLPSPSGMDSWKQQLLVGNSSFFLLDNGGPEQKLCYVTPRVIEGEYTAVTVIELNPDALLQTFAQAQESYPNASALCILFDDQILSLEGQAAGEDTAAALFARWKENPLSGPVRQDGIVGFFSESMLPDLYYASFYTENDTMKTVRATAFICVTGAFLSLIIAIAGSLYIGSRSQRPLRRLLAKLGASEDKGDSYELLDSKVETLLETHSKDRKLLSEHQLLLDASFLRAALRGELRSESAAFAAANRYGVSFEGTAYQVLLFSGEGELFSESEQWRSPLDSLLRREQAKGLAAFYNGRLCVLLNTDAPLSETSLRELCIRILDLLCPGRAAAAGIGNAYDSMASIVTSYQCARRALLSCEPSEQHPVCRYTPDMAAGHHGNTKSMQLFSRQIYQKQYDQARKTLDQLCEEYLSTSAVPSSDVLRQQAVSSLLMDAACESLPEQETSELWRLLSLPCTLSEYRLRVQGILDHLDRVQMELPAESKPLPIAVRAKEILDENYTDPMIGLYFVSERLNVSNSYLSTAFKNMYQISVTQYINSLRIERAKSLMAETSMSVRDVALAVGFSSDASFIRVFKKQENKTPTMFRTDCRHDT